MGNRILLVEDEKNIARFIELELRHEGFDVVHHISGRGGLEAAKSWNLMWFYWMSCYQS